jgi:hypothetical protein
MPRWTGLWIVLAAMAGCSLFGPHSMSSSDESGVTPANLPASSAAGPSISARGRAELLSQPDLPAPTTSEATPPGPAPETGPAAPGTMLDPLGPLPKPQFLARSLRPVETDPTADTHVSGQPDAAATPGLAEVGADPAKAANREATSAGTVYHITPSPAMTTPCPAPASTTPTGPASTQAKAVSAAKATPPSVVASADATPPASQPRAQFTGGIDTAAPEAPARGAAPALPSQLPDVVQASNTAPAAEGLAPPVGAALEPTTPHVTNVSTETSWAGASGRAQPAAHRQASSQTSVRVVNSKRFNLDYEVRDVGSSGVAGVELWYTQDGNTWHKHDAKLHHRSPYVIEVAEEDLYGFTLVAHTGSGLSGRVPRTGDAPQVWVEVDVTRPAVRLLDVQPGTGAEAGTLDVLWQATDKNLDPHPITLSYAESADGPWAPIAAHLENTGRYAWHMPAGVPARLLVRIEALDRAGNVGAAQTPAPLAADVTLPTTSIRDVEPAH